MTSTGDLKYLYDVKNYDRLQVDNTESLSMLWGDIVLEYGKLDNNFSIDNSFESQKIIYQLEASFVAIKAMIRILMFVTPRSKKPESAELATKTIKDLKKLGYIIDITDSKAYAKSISSADKRSNSIITQIKLRKSEMDYDEDSSSPISFDTVISSLNSALGFIVPEGITVARYCAYKKSLIKKSKNVT